MSTTPAPAFPFVALVGQDEMRLALLLGVVEPRLGGVLLLGQRGTGKSTAVRALAALMPALAVVEGCPYHCPPDQPAGLCPRCTRGATPLATTIPVPVVDLPLGASVDRVTGSLDLEAALLRGERTFEPGLLARANRGFLYIDEVNLLEDHLVDLLLDVAASGQNVVEREAISVHHPARFVLVGSGNPEEGELRPQLVDRFGLCVEVTAEGDLERRCEITRRRLRFEEDARRFVGENEAATARLRAAIEAGRARLPEVALPEPLLLAITRLNAGLEVPGHRGELTLARAARALAALEARSTASLADARRVAPMALRHRLRRDPLESPESAARLEAAIAEHLAGG